MFELTYTDSYHQVRSQTYENLNEIMLAFSGCLTLPDYLKVTSLKRDGVDLNYTDTIGNLYFFLGKLNQAEKESV